MTTIRYYKKSNAFFGNRLHYRLFDRLFDPYDQSEETFLHGTRIHQKLLNFSFEMDHIVRKNLISVENDDLLIMSVWLFKPTV